MSAARSGTKRKKGKGRSSRRGGDRPEPDSSLKFSKVNAYLALGSLAAIAVGYALLAQGSVTLAPLLLVLGYVVLAPMAIIL